MLRSKIDIKISNVDFSHDKPLALSKKTQGKHEEKFLYYVSISSTLRKIRHFLKKA
ncbi:hypothetical protein PU02_1005 [Bartonella ancashensis]|uniref:Uncharacterized protein n=1 Tax=Bartonella ancashensis TaxID=1318743 RepID=A0A0M4LH06_9HYPH|nr:hypothetical protein PU02_1005 [Bartonella ancashensis]